MKIFVRIIAFQLLTLFCSCTTNNNSTIEFDHAAISNTVCEEIDEQILNSSHIFGSPSQISIVNDSTLIVLDRAENGKIAHLFSTNGTYIKSFGKIGQGPTEYISPEIISISELENNIYIYDFALTNSGVYNIDSLRQGKDQISRISYKNHLNDDIFCYEAVVHFSDSNYICMGITETCRLLSNINGKQISIYREYPPLIENPEHNRSAWNNGSEHAISPDGKHIVYATWIGMAFEILENNNGNIQSKIVKGFYEPKYNVAHGAVPACIYSSNDCFEGFRTIFATNTGFYGCVSGEAPKYNQGNIIYYFDYNGVLLRKIRIPSIIDCLAVKNNTLYAIAHAYHEENRLIKVDL